MRVATVDGLVTLFYDGSKELYNVELSHEWFEGAAEGYYDNDEKESWEDWPLSDECKIYWKDRQSWQQIIVIEGVTEIPEMTFHRCENIKRVIMADTVIRIERNAFYCCFNLIYIKLSIYLEYIGVGTFGFCDLISVFIPPNCREIGGYAFDENKNLTIFNVSQHTAIGEDIIKRAKLLQDSHFELNERGYYHNQSEEVNNWLKNMNNDVTLNCRNTIAMTVSAGTAWARDHAHLYERNRQGLESIILSLKRQPTAIRYQASSALAQQMARDVHERIVSDQIFHFRNKSCLLLVLDRVDDPVTPLLSQWTYQAMVHELLGLNTNRVVLKGAPNVAKELEEVVLSPTEDDFFRKNRHSNFGELGEAIQKLLKDYQAQTQTANASNLNTIEDMQNFMDKFPELRSQSHNVSKHVALMGELARLVEVCSLMDVSQFEQELACADDQSIHVRELMDKLGSMHIKVPDKLRLGLLFALRYEHSSNLHKVKSEMRKGGVSDEMIDLTDTILKYAGSRSRGPGLYGVGTKDIMSKMTKSFMTSVQGVQNVYAQHNPVLFDTLQLIQKGKLKQDSHPFIMGRGGVDDVPSEVIIFMAGGVTYEEAAKVSEFNRTHMGRMKVILGGSTIHNSTSFLEELKSLP